jgi:hypothetical protein
MSYREREEEDIKGYRGISEEVGPWNRYDYTP